MLIGVCGAAVPWPQSLPQPPRILVEVQVLTMCGRWAGLNSDPPALGTQEQRTPILWHLVPPLLPGSLVPDKVVKTECPWPSCPALCLAQPRCLRRYLSDRERPSPHGCSVGLGAWWPRGPL